MALEIHPKAKAIGRSEREQVSFGVKQNSPTVMQWAASRQEIMRHHHYLYCRQLRMGSQNSGPKDPVPWQLSQSTVGELLALILLSHL